MEQRRFNSRGLFWRKHHSNIEWNKIFCHCKTKFTWSLTCIEIFMNIMMAETISLLLVKSGTLGQIFFAGSYDGYNITIAGHEISKNEDSEDGYVGKFTQMGVLIG